MKIIYTLLLSSVILVSCDNTDKKDETTTPEDKEVQQIETELTDSEKLSTRWVLVNRRNESGDKSKDFEKEPTSIVTYFEDNGYFRVYDSITEARNEDGVQKIEQRNSGQWEINEDGILVLRFTKPDTVIVEEFEIQELDKDKLIIKSLKKDVISRYEKKL
tara:strand:- start:36976 stop:37458 length:483 start_codon:yes stop_codon:yes gene_type:complete